MSSGREVRCQRHCNLRLLYTIQEIEHRSNKIRGSSGDNSDWLIAFELSRTLRTLLYLSLLKNVLELYYKLSALHNYIYHLFTLFPFISASGICKHYKPRHESGRFSAEKELYFVNFAVKMKHPTNKLWLTFMTVMKTVIGYRTSHICFNISSWMSVTSRTLTKNCWSCPMGTVAHTAQFGYDPVTADAHVWQLLSIPLVVRSCFFYFLPNRRRRTFEMFDGATID